jgi:radical SAM protein with 4Fe4S-binding SPASM domain
LTVLAARFPQLLPLINDIDISLDAPTAEEHDKNRGKKGLFNVAMKALSICTQFDIPHSIIQCGMNWNFTEAKIIEMLKLAKATGANYRVNPMKPTEPRHMGLVLTPNQFYKGIDVILQHANPVDLTDANWATAAGLDDGSVHGCPCGTSSFRINGINQSGEMPLSPCVYLHDKRVGDLLTENVADIISRTEFEEFRLRKANPELVAGCANCGEIGVCAGGCASRAYLHKKHETGGKERDMFAPDPYCFAKHGTRTLNQVASVQLQTHNGIEQHGVHEGYLCTGIFSPK